MIVVLPYNTETVCTNGESLFNSSQASAEESIISSNNVGTFYKFVNKRLSNRNKILTITDKHVMW